MFGLRFHCIYRHHQRVQEQLPLIQRFKQKKKVEFLVSLGSVATLWTNKLVQINLKAHVDRKICMHKK